MSIQNLITELRRLRADAIDNKCEATITANAVAAVNAIEPLCAEVKRLTAEVARLRDEAGCHSQNHDIALDQRDEARADRDALRAKLDRLVASAPSTSETKDEWLRRHHSAQTDFEELAWSNLMDWRAAIADAT